MKTSLVRIIFCILCALLMGSKATAHFTNVELDRMFEALIQWNVAESPRKGKIGVIVRPDLTTHKTYIFDFQKGSPAQNSGLATGDCIIAINRISVIGKTMPQIGNMMQGESGLTVSVTIIRQGEPEPLTFNVVRQ